MLTDLVMVVHVIIHCNIRDDIIKSRYKYELKYTLEVKIKQLMWA